MPQLSNITNDAEQAMSIKYNTMVYELQRMGKEVLVMSLGEAFFDIPLMEMNSLPNPQIYHYSHSMGIPGLREKLAEYFLKEYDIPINYEKEILITAGSKAAIHFTLMSILDPGDEVIIPEPAWVSYPEQVKLCYANPVSLPYNIKVNDYENYITEKTKAIIICHPHNPTGYVYSEGELDYLLSLAKKHNIWLLSDEAYSEFTPDNSFTSLGKIDRNKEHSIIFNSISKNYGISGWRLGYVIGNESLIHNILKVNQHLITCPATILELYVEKYFYEILEYTKPQIRALLKRRNELSSYMDEIGLKYLPGDSTFYYFVSISPSKLSSEDFCSKLLYDEYISTVPGLGYGKSCDEFIRISVGTATTEENKRGLLKIKQLIDKTTSLPNKKKKAVVVAGGVWQVPLIKFLKDKNYHVIVVDPYKYSPGVQIANHHIPIDVRYADKIIDNLKDFDFDFVVTDQSDISVKTVSKISEFFNKKSNKPTAIELFVDKLEMRQHTQINKTPAPTFRKIENIEQLNEFISNTGLPVILKPTNSQSSRGVQKITEDNLTTLESAFVESLKYTDHNYILAEKFVQGIEITVEGFASNYKHKSLALSRKEHFRTGIASELNYPAAIPPDLYRKIIQINDKYIESTSLEFGITHAEYIVDIETQEINLIEVACRGGGNLISSDILNWITGLDIYELLLDNIEGKSIDLTTLHVQNRPASLRFFEFPDGKIKKISGSEEAKLIEGVHKLELFVKEGDTITQAKDDRSRHGYVIIYGKNREEIEHSFKKVVETIKIE